MENTVALESRIILGSIRLCVVRRAITFAPSTEDVLDPLQLDSIINRSPPQTGR